MYVKIFGRKMFFQNRAAFEEFLRFIDPEYDADFVIVVQEQ